VEEQGRRWWRVDVRRERGKEIHVPGVSAEGIRAVIN
jgi:hypothetical protein